MIDLKEIYGSRAFDRKAAYSHAAYIPYIAEFFIDIVIALAIISVFDVHWEYAFLKVFALIYLLGFLKFVISYLINILNYKFSIKNSMILEIKHYLNLFKYNVSQSEAATYDEFLLESAFNKNLSIDLRLFAAINYGTIAALRSFDPHYDDRSYSLFSKIAPDFTPKDFKTKYQTID
jgi:ABC-type multidrug transport system fused ATPase/permease subunit